MNILSQIRNRPSYHLACIWLENSANDDGTPRTAETRIDVGWFGNVLRLVTGADVSEETLLVALTDRGYTVISTRRGLRVNMDERLVVDLLPQISSGAYRPRSLAQYGDRFA